jgi:hypothetical protein
MNINLDCGCKITVYRTVNINHIEWFIETEYLSDICEKHINEMNEELFRVRKKRKKHE